MARNGKGPRTPHLVINNILGICAPASAASASPCCRIIWSKGRRTGATFSEADPIALDAYFVYPEELKTVARVQAFRDFLVANAQRWNF